MTKQTAKLVYFSFRHPRHQPASHWPRCGHSHWISGYGWARVFCLSLSVCPSVCALGSLVISGSLSHRPRGNPGALPALRALCPTQAGDQSLESVCISAPCLSCTVHRRAARRPRRPKNNGQDAAFSRAVLLAYASGLPEVQVARPRGGMIRVAHHMGVQHGGHLVSQPPPLRLGVDSCGRWEHRGRLLPEARLDEIEGGPCGHAAVGALGRAAPRSLREDRRLPKGSSGLGLGWAGTSRATAKPAGPSARACVKQHEVKTHSADSSMRLRVLHATRKLQLVLSGSRPLRLSVGPRTTEAAGLSTNSWRQAIGSRRLSETGQARRRTEGLKDRRMSPRTHSRGKLRGTCPGTRNSVTQCLRLLLTASPEVLCTQWTPVAHCPSCFLRALIGFFKRKLP